MSRTLSGRTIVITGAARGIGRVIAEAALARGARVSIADIDAETLTATAAELAPTIIRLSTSPTPYPFVGI